MIYHVGHASYEVYDLKLQFQLAHLRFVRLTTPEIFNKIQNAHSFVWVRSQNSAEKIIAIQIVEFFGLCFYRRMPLARGREFTIHLMLSQLNRDEW